MQGSSDPTCNQFSYVVYHNIDLLETITIKLVYPMLGISSQTLKLISKEDHVASSASSGVHPARDRGIRSTSLKEDLEARRK